MSTFLLSQLYMKAKRACMESGETEKLTGDPAMPVIIVDGEVALGTNLIASSHILASSADFYINASALSAAAPEQPGAKPLAGLFLGIMGAEGILQSALAPPGSARIMLFTDSDEPEQPSILPLVNARGDPLLPTRAEGSWVVALKRATEVTTGSLTGIQNTSMPIKPGDLLKKPKAAKGELCGPHGTGRVSLTGTRSASSGAPFMSNRSYRRAQVYAAGTAIPPSHHPHACLPLAHR